MEKPILFNTEMVNAILDGRKTMTRRLVKPQPVYRPNWGTSGYEWKHAAFTNSEFKNGMTRFSPYQPGDILWVRETFAIGKIDCGEEPDGTDAPYISQCKGESDFIPKEYALRNDIGIDDVIWKPSIFMPREAARLFLRVKNVRVEMLQDITAEDIRSEGLTSMGVHCGDMGLAIPEWKILWDSTIKKQDLNKYGWDANPWVWVIEFERVVKES